MKKKQLQIKFLFLALHLILISLFNLYLLEKTTQILWYCDFICFYLAMALILKNSKMTSAVLIATWPILAIWLVNVLALGIEKFSWISIYMHLIVLPTALYAVSQFGYSKDGLKYAILTLLILFASIYLWTMPAENINCAFAPCAMAYTFTGLQNWGVSYVIQFLFFIILVLKFSDVLIRRIYLFFNLNLPK